MILPGRGQQSVACGRERHLGPGGRYSRSTPCSPPAWRCWHGAGTAWCVCTHDRRSHWPGANSAHLRIDKCVRRWSCSEHVTSSQSEHAEWYVSLLQICVESKGLPCPPNITMRTFSLVTWLVIGLSLSFEGQVTDLLTGSPKNSKSCNDWTFATFA